MADTVSRSETSVTVEVTAAPSISLESVPTVPVLRLKLKKPKKKKVGWTTDTVDNEHLNKKKSKCCCIYEKPHKFGESSSESDSDDSCDQCRGHTDKEKKDTAGDANDKTSTPPAPSTSTDS